MMRQARGGSPNDIYSARLEAAELIYQAELRIAKTEMDRLDADANKKQAIYEAEMERLDKIEEMINRQKEEFEQNVQGLVHAARTGGIGGWVTGRLESLGDQVLAKIAGGIFDKLRTAAGGKTVSIPDVLGGAAKGSDVDQNTVATQDNTNATRDLTGVMRDISGMPGGSGASSGLGPMYGLPTSGGAGGGGGGFPGLGGSTLGKVGSYAGAAFLGYQGVRSLAKGG